MNETQSGVVTFICRERGCDFDLTTDAALAADHEVETGHKMSAVPGDPKTVLARYQAEQHQTRVQAIVRQLPVPPREYVVFDASDPGIKLAEVIEQTAQVDIVSQFDRWVKMPRGYATIGFLRQLFAVTG